MTNKSSDLAQHVISSLDERRTLVRVLDRTTNVKAELAGVKADLTASRSKLASTSQTSTILTKRLDGHTAKSSSFKSIFAKNPFSRKSQAKAAVEKDTVSAGITQWGGKAKNQTKLTEVKIEDLKKKKDELEKKLGERLDAEDALGNIYATLFDGPTPEYPDEDECEAKVRDAEKKLNASQCDVSHIASVSNTLYMVQMRVRSSLDSIAKALLYATTDPTAERLNDSGRVSKILHNLKWTNRSAIEAMELLSKAQGMDPEIKGHGKPQLIDARPYLSSSNSTNLDTIWREMTTPVQVPAEVLSATNIGLSQKSLQSFAQYVEEELVRIDDRKNALAEDRDTKQVVLDAAKDDLLEFRTQLCAKICSF